MNDKPESNNPKPEENQEKKPVEKPTQKKTAQEGTDIVDLLLLLLIVFFMGSALLLQYQKPLVVGMLDKLLGKPQPVTVMTIPTLPAPTIPAQITTTTQKALPPLELPRSYREIKFLTSFAVAKPFILRKYNPVHKNISQKGDRWRIIFDGSKITESKRNITLEYMGNESLGTPRYLTFYFYKYSMTGVMEKYFKVDPMVKLKDITANYGAYTFKEELPGKHDRYLWDDGGMKMTLLVNRTNRSSILLFQMKEFERKL